MSEKGVAEKEIRLRHLVGYGCGEFYGGGSFIVISMLFMFFLTDVAKLPPTLAGLIVLIGKGWDAVSDPLMGYISDNIKTRYGRRRIFFLVGVVPVALTFAMLWIALHTSSELFNFCYYALSYLLFSTTFTMVLIPYRALNAEMSSDYRVRTRLTTAKMIVSQFSALLSAALPKIMVDRLFPGDPAKGFLVMGICFGLLYSLPWLIVFFSTWEIELPAAEIPPGVLSFFSQFKTLFISRSFRIHLGLYISAYTAMDILMAMFIYYLKYYLDREGLYSACVGPMFVTSMAVMPLHTYLANRKGKAASYIVGLCIWFVAMILLFFLDPATPAGVVIALSVFIGMGLSAAVSMPWAMLPEIIDVDELICGRQRAGICSGAMTLVRKLVQAMALFLLGVMLDLIGYMPDVAQTSSTLFWMRVLFVLLPGLFIISGILFARRFRITPVSHQILKAELERRRSATDFEKQAEPDPKTRSVCEALTGIPAEKLWAGRPQSPA